MPQVVEPVHLRSFSQSTTASCSPSSQNGDVIVTGNRQMATAGVVGPRGTLAAAKGYRTQKHRRLGFGVTQNEVGQGRAEATKASGATMNGKIRGNGEKLGTVASRRLVARQTTMDRLIVQSKTPAVTARHARAELSRSPGGTDYIVTPGRHKILMTEFLASFDQQPTGCPLLNAAGNYMEMMHLEWLRRERELDNRIFLLSFADDVPMEEFRQMAIQAVFNYAVEHGLHEKTIHLTAFNISRLIYAQISQSSAKALTHELFGCTVIAALRHAVKSDESYEKSDRFRLDPCHVWRASPFLSSFCRDKSVARLNAVEADCLKLLNTPNNPPLAPEFFDRYLEVGQWPVLTEQYRELGSYLMGLALFSSGGSKNHLKGTPGSQLAAAALVLAIKVINTDNNNQVKYEFWPSRLQAYTGFTLDNLKPAIRGLASLLRKKPQQSLILEKYYSKWA